MTDTVSYALGIALGATLYLLAKHLVIDGLRLHREIKATRKQIELEQWRAERLLNSRITHPTSHLNLEGIEPSIPYLGIDDVPVFTERNRSE